MAERLEVDGGDNRQTHTDAREGATAKPRSADKKREPNSIEHEREAVQDIDEQVRLNASRLVEWRLRQATKAAADDVPERMGGGSGAGSAGERGNDIEDNDAFHALNRKPLPKDVERTYLKVGDAYHYVVQPKKKAFVDRGDKLETRQSDAALVRDLVRVAEHRGWDRLRLRGSKRFRQEAWVQATALGLQAGGYTPTERDIAMAERLRQGVSVNAIEKTVRAETGRKPTRVENARAAGSASPRTEPKSEGTARGELLEHGPAPYQFRKGAAENYYVRYLDASGEEKVVWGVGLRRAIEESKAEKGDRIELSRKGREKVEVERAVRDNQGKVVGRVKKVTHRNVWEAKAESFSRDKPREAVKKHPELVNGYAMMQAASLVAEQRFADPVARQTFLSRFQDALTGQIAEGKPLPAVGIRQRRIERESERVAAEPKR